MYCYNLSIYINPANFVYTIVVVYIMHDLYVSFTCACFCVME